MTITVVEIILSLAALGVGCVLTYLLTWRILAAFAPEFRVVRQSEFGIGVQYTPQWRLYGTRFWFDFMDDYGSHSFRKMETAQNFIHNHIAQSSHKANQTVVSIIKK
jgi:hypothetical protein